MAPTAIFTLCDHVQGVFTDLCEEYGIDSCWLQWKYELAMTAGATSPFKITNNDSAHFEAQEYLPGVEKVKFEVHYIDSNPNHIKFIKFTEFPECKEYLITQTSIDHVQEHEDCPLWIEVPHGAKSMVSLKDVEPCCDDWMNSLPTYPFTTLEKAKRLFACEDNDWLKGQLAAHDASMATLKKAAQSQDTQIESLKNHIKTLTAQLEEKNSRAKDPKEAPKTPTRKRKTPAKALMTPDSPFSRMDLSMPSTWTDGVLDSPKRIKQDFQQMGDALIEGDMIDEIKFMTP